MSLIQLVVFSTAGILIGAIKTPAFRIRIILFFSALAIYWLQPPSAIRYLEFWFPTLTIALVILVYTVCFPDSIRSRQNLVDLGILLAAWLAAGLLRYHHRSLQHCFADSRGSALPAKGEAGVKPGLCGPDSGCLPISEK
jgi:hypothetical protein